jgi:predicted transposase YdaD
MTTLEIQQMLNLTPLEETVAVKELIAVAELRGEKRGEARGEKRGEARGEKRGEKRGALLGRIRAFQEMLGLPTSSPDSLRRQSLPELEQLAAELQARLQR